MGLLTYKGGNCSTNILFLSGHSYLFLDILPLVLLRTKYLGHIHDFFIERKIHNNSKFFTQTLFNNFFNSVFARDIISFWS